MAQNGAGKSPFAWTAQAERAAALVAWLGTFEAGELAGVAAAAAGVIEVGWGFMDQMLKSGQNAVDPKPVAAGGERGRLT